MNPSLSEQICNIYPPINNHGNTCFISSSDYNPHAATNRSGLEHEEFLQQTDQEFIINFINTKGICKTSKGKDLPLKIFEARKYLMHVMSLKQELQTECLLLDIHSDEFDTKWEEIVAKKCKINDILAKFNTEALSLLKTAISKRKKKRVWERKQKEDCKRIKKERKDNIKKRHNLIDKLLDEKIKEVESEKRKEALKRQADTVLHEVRKKKHEAKKMLNMLTALLKLRELRSQQEIAQGGYCSQQLTETFNNVICYLKNLWEQQSEKYNLEEKGLRVMLEESEFPQMKIPNFEKILNQWEQAFFGMPSTDDACKFLTQADNDINSMIFIRKEWDNYLTDITTPLSSCIPVGWIIPPETDNEEWKGFVRSSKK